jgi:hypothetical protein
LFLKERMVFARYFRPTAGKIKFTAGNFNVQQANLMYSRQT